MCVCVSIVLAWNVDLLMSFCQIGFAPNLQSLDFTVVSPLGLTHVLLKWKHTAAAGRGGRPTMVQAGGCGFNGCRGKWRFQPCHEAYYDYISACKSQV